MFVWVGDEVDEGKKKIKKNLDAVSAPCLLGSPCYSGLLLFGSVMKETGTDTRFTILALQEGLSLLG